MSFDEIEIFFAAVPAAEREEIISQSLRAISADPERYPHLLRLADVYWRMEDWKHTIEFGLRAHRLRPSSFHATKILVFANARTEESELCYKYAKHLIHLGPNDWRKARYISWMLLPFALLLKSRSPYHWWRAQYQRESKSDVDAFIFAKDFISWYEATNPDTLPNSAFERTD
jgi:hypothetical protein